MLFPSWFAKTKLQLQPDKQVLITRLRLFNCSNQLLVKKSSTQKKDERLLKIYKMQNIKYFWYLGLCYTIRHRSKILVCFNWGPRAFRAVKIHRPTTTVIIYLIRRVIGLYFHIFVTFFQLYTVGWKDERPWGRGSLDTECFSFHWG